MLRLKRVYEPAARSDGQRILVDRLWPRGLSKKNAAIDEWMKDIAPSNELRKWFAHDPKKWIQFKRRYREELKAHNDLVRRIATQAAHRRVTLVYAARDEQHNDAVVLAEVLRARIARAGTGSRKRKMPATRSARAHKRRKESR